MLPPPDSIVQRMLQAVQRKRPFLNLRTGAVGTGASPVRVPTREAKRMKYPMKQVGEQEIFRNLGYFKLFVFLKTPCRFLALKYKG